MKRLYLLRPTLLALLLLTLTACQPPDLDEITIQVTLMSTADAPATAIIAGVDAATAAPNSPTQTAPTTATSTPTPRVPRVPLPTRASYSGTPTPDPPHPQADAAYLEHIVQAGETLATIAQLHNLTLDELLALNALSTLDLIYVGQALRISAAPQAIGPTQKLIPDSEVVYGPTAVDTDIERIVKAYNGHLLRLQDEVEGRLLSGVEVLNLVAIRFSIHPRLLLAMLEYRTGWVSQSQPSVSGNYFMGNGRPGYEGLYLQMAWAANEINAGFYGRAEGGQSAIFLAGDETRIAFHPEINHGTAAVQRWLGAHDSATYDTWLRDTSTAGFYATYNRLFGNPFGYTFEPLWPNKLRQPTLQLPFQPDVPWYYTGGPHGGWAGGSAWAALDFAPDKDQRGCYVSETWATAVADGLISYSDFGGILLDLDGDGDIGTGWVIVYWHIDDLERIPAGEPVKAGQPLGHASCEGGYSNGTHIHIARRYNGRWVAADGDTPFNMDGWVSQGLGQEYDGLLVRDDIEKEACVCAEELNELRR